MKARSNQMSVCCVSGSHGVQPPAGDPDHGPEEQAGAAASHLRAFLPVHTDVWPGGPARSDGPWPLGGIRHTQGHSHLPGQGGTARYWKTNSMMWQALKHFFKLFEQEAAFRKVVQATMVRDRQHGPVVELNRIQVLLETHAYSSHNHSLWSTFKSPAPLTVVPSPCEAAFQTGSWLLHVMSFIRGLFHGVWSALQLVCRESFLLLHPFPLHLTWVVSVVGAVITSWSCTSGLPLYLAGSC